MNLFVTTRVRPVLLLWIALLATACGTLQLELEPELEATAVVSTIPAQPQESDEETITPADIAPEPSPAMTPTQIATPDSVATPQTTSAALVVIYIKEHNIWRWVEGQGTTRLTKNGGVERVKVSTDGLQVAFIRGGNIWSVDADGTSERQITTEEIFSEIVLGDAQAGPVFLSQPFQIDWLGNSRTLIFNTFPGLNGPGIGNTDDLWSINTGDTEPIQIAPPGDGGRFTIAPGGDHIALTRPGSVHLIQSDGVDNRQLLSHDPVKTYSEVLYYAEPNWHLDGLSLGIAIPPSDPLSDPDQPSLLYIAEVDGSVQEIGGVITIPSLQAAPQFSPALNYVAYMAGNGPDKTSGVEYGNLVIQRITDGSLGAIVSNVESAISFETWSPDESHFVFTAVEGNEPIVYISDLDGNARPISGPEGKLIDLTWVSPDRFLYLHFVGRGWDLRLGNIYDQESVLIDFIVGGPPSFDFAATSG